MAASSKRLATNQVSTTTCHGCSACPQRCGSPGAGEMSSPCCESGCRWPNGASMRNRRSMPNCEHIRPPTGIALGARPPCTEERCDCALPCLPAGDARSVPPRSLSRGGRQRICKKWPRFAPRPPVDRRGEGRQHRSNGPQYHPHRSRSAVPCGKRPSLVAVAFRARCDRPATDPKTAHAVPGNRAPPSGHCASTRAGDMTCLTHSTITRRSAVSATRGFR